MTVACARCWAERPRLELVDDGKNGEVCIDHIREGLLDGIPPWFTIRRPPREPLPAHDKLRTDYLGRQANGQARATPWLPPRWLSGLVSR